MGSGNLISATAQSAYDYDGRYESTRRFNRANGGFAHSSLERLWEGIYFTNFMTKNRITSSALSM